MNLSGEFIAIATTLCWSIGIFPFTEATKRIGAEAVNLYRLLLAWGIISVILFFSNHLNLADLFISPTVSQYLYLGASGIIGFSIGDYCSFNSFKLLGPKLASLYTTFAPSVALLIGYIALNESVNTIGLMGMAITIAGVVWLTFSKKDSAEALKVGYTRNTKGIIYGVIGALCQGTGLVLSKIGMNSEANNLPTMHAVWIRLLFGFASLFIISFLLGRLKLVTKPIITNEKNNLPFILFGTITGPVMGVSLSLLAIQTLEVAVAQTIFALLPLFVLPISAIVYKEKITLQAVLACAVALLGVLILIWRNSF